MPRKASHVARVPRRRPSGSNSLGSRGGVTVALVAVVGVLALGLAEIAATGSTGAHTYAALAGTVSALAVASRRV